MRASKLLAGWAVILGGAAMSAAQDAPATVERRTGSDHAVAGPPMLRTIRPFRALPGEEVTLEGSNFGGRRGTVRLGRRAVRIRSWVEGAIVIAMPRLPAGRYALAISNAAGRSDSGDSLIVLDPPFVPARGGRPPCAKLSRIDPRFGSPDRVLGTEPLAADGETLVVGGEDDGVSVYVGSRRGWTLQQRIGTPAVFFRSRSSAEYAFGNTVAIDGDTLVVTGEERERAYAIEPSLFLYGRSDGVWTFRQRIVQDEAVLPQESDLRAGTWGNCLDVSGDTLAVTVHAQGNGWGGGVVVYRRTGDVFRHEATLARSRFEPGPLAARIDGDTAAVYLTSGEVDVYRRNAGAWERRQVLDTGPDDGFYGPLALDGDLLLVGRAYSQESPDAVFVFRRSGEEWALERTLSAEGAAGFGMSVDVSGGLIAISSAAQGRDGRAAAGQVHLVPRDDVDLARARVVRLRDDTLKGVDARNGRHFAVLGADRLGAVGPAAGIVWAYGLSGR